MFASSLRAAIKRRSATWPGGQRAVRHAGHRRLRDACLADHLV